ncbi:short-chain dehydrogenase [Pseudomonas khavaziana]|uniref:Short-chain dehydrogenase n=1 Tax=Pseudomonas khavaziana TaxID=2842351 RepID=A0ABZ2DPR2_9PSED
METLLDAATYRLRAATQLLENLALRSEISSDAVLSDFALLCSIALRDGCDLLDVTGRRMAVPSGLLKKPGIGITIRVLE